MQELEAKLLLGFEGSEISIPGRAGLASQASVHRTLGESDYLGLWAQLNFSVQGYEPWHKVSAC